MMKKKKKIENFGDDYWRLWNIKLNNYKYEYKKVKISRVILKVCKYSELVYIQGSTNLEEVQTEQRENLKHSG